MGLLAVLINMINNVSHCLQHTADGKFSPNKPAADFNWFCHEKAEQWTEHSKRPISSLLSYGKEFVVLRLADWNTKESSHS
jgi:hypothetical protein